MINIIDIDHLGLYTWSSISEAWIEQGSHPDTILNIDYVPTEVELLKREVKELKAECYEAQCIIEFGDIPEATENVVANLHTKIITFGCNPMDVVEELFREHGMTGTCHQFGRVA